MLVFNVASGYPPTSVLPALRHQRVQWVAARHVIDGVVNDKALERCEWVITSMEAIPCVNHPVAYSLNVLAHPGPLSEIGGALSP